MQMVEFGSFSKLSENHFLVNIRQARPEDEGALKQIVLAVIYQNGYPPSWIETAHANFDISADFLKTHEVYVAEESGELRGFSVIRDGALDDLWIHPSSFGTGIGKQLFLEAMEKIAKPQAIRVI